MKLYQAKRHAFVFYGNSVSSRRYHTFKLPVVGWVRGRTLRRVFLLACVTGWFFYAMASLPFPLPMVQ
ncbi:hypothetical protein LDR46_004388 [Salmonella enterica]|nr:hypothetical protein [Salmonella enterica]